MSWKASLSRHLPILRFFACPTSPSSKGVISYYKKNYDSLKTLNPTLPLFLRTADNTFPAVTTELDFTTDDLLRYMIQTKKFRDWNGNLAQDRIDAAHAYLHVDWALLRRERWACPNFDPEHPLLDKIDPDWKSDPYKREKLALYMELKNSVDEQMRVIQSGPDNEYTRAENALLMCQRVDLWCAGEREVEAAVRHLYMLGRRFNAVTEKTFEMPEYVAEYYPGVSDL